MPPSEGIVNWLTVDEIDNVEEEVGQQDPVDNGTAQKCQERGHHRQHLGPPTKDHVTDVRKINPRIQLTWKWYNLLVI